MVVSGILLSNSFINTLCSEITHKKENLLTFLIQLFLYVESTPNFKSEEEKASVILKIKCLNSREQLRVQEESNNPKNRNSASIRRSKDHGLGSDELSPVIGLFYFLS